MAKQKLNQWRNWYVLQTYSGYEHAVKTALLQRITSLSMEDKIFNVLVPEETHVEKTKTGTKEVKKRIFPGYVFIEMIVTDDSWYAVRNCPNVTWFLWTVVTPVPISPEEYWIIEAQISKDKKTAFKGKFNIGDLIIIKEGPFSANEAIISEVDEEKGIVKVTVSLFGRETPLELEFNQIKKK